MSDAELDAELLQLVEPKKRKKASSKSKGSSKRRKTSDSDSDSEDEGELYPLEGKYIDENDRERLMSMSELEREAIIEKRLEEKDKKNQSQKLSEFFAANQNQDSVSQAAKRQHTARGHTKEKDKKLSELKAKRRAKAESTRTKDGSPKRDRSSSPMDMETDEEEEDGQIKYDEEEEPVNKNDLLHCWLPRDALVRHFASPWFADLAIGSWVRYLIGAEDGNNVYRICEVVGVGSEPVKPYKIGDTIVDQTLELRHGKSTKMFLMDKVSNTCFNDREFARLESACKQDQVRLPSKLEIEKKRTQISKLSSQTMTESDVAAMVARKYQMSHRPSRGLTPLERARLVQARTLAERRQDFAEVADLDAQLAGYGALDNGIGDDMRNARTEDSVLARLSERNRKANSEAVRKAELMEAERRRRERKLAQAGKSGTVTPTDPSARLRTVPRTLLSSPSRSGTPNLGGDSLQAPSDELRSISPVPSNTKLFESTVVNSIEVDLGDF